MMLLNHCSTYHPKPACHALRLPVALLAPSARSPCANNLIPLPRRHPAFQQRQPHTIPAALPGVDMIPATTVMADLADLNPSTAGTLAFILRPLFTIATLLFIVRIVLTWFPEQVLS